jgi:hypothetical protein
MVASRIQQYKKYFPIWRNYDGLGRGNAPLQSLDAEILELVSERKSVAKKGEQKILACVYIIAIDRFSVLALHAASFWKLANWPLPQVRS